MLRIASLLREALSLPLFYSFDLDKVVPPDHLVRQIDVHNELAPFYSHTGRPSIDPALMIRMLIVGCRPRVDDDGDSE